MVATYVFNGAINSISATSGLVFAGPTVQISTSAGQRMTSSAAAVLGFTTVTTTSILVGICYQPSGGGALTVFAGSNFTSVQLLTTRQIYAAAGSVVPPSAGTWKVGYCVNNLSTSVMSNVDFVNGWVMVTGP